MRGGHFEKQNTAGSLWLIFIPLSDFQIETQKIDGKKNLYYYFVRQF